VVGAPILGGALIAWDVAGWGWRTVFLVNLPLGLPALALAAVVLPESRADDGPRPDPLGMVLVSTGLALLVFPLVEGRGLDWPSWTFALLAAGAAVLAVFAGHQVWRRREGRAPLVEPELFRLRAFTAGMAVGLALFAGMSGLVLALGLYLQLGLGYTRLVAGLTQAPWAVGIAGGSALSGAVLAARLGRTGLQLGTLVTVAGLGGWC
jgi:MFS family permease